MRSSWLTKSVPGAGRVRQAVVADADVAAHAAGEIDDHVDLALADLLDDFTVVARGHAEGAGLRVAHVNVHDRGAGAGRRDGGIGDLLGVIAQCGLFVTLVSSPVTAQVIMTS
jgi:hypothetical protein